MSSMHAPSRKVTSVSSCSPPSSMITRCRDIRPMLAAHSACTMLMNASLPLAARYDDGRPITGTTRTPRSSTRIGSWAARRIPRCGSRSAAASTAAWARRSPICRCSSRCERCCTTSNLPPPARRANETTPGVWQRRRPAAVASSSTAGLPIPPTRAQKSPRDLNRMAASHVWTVERRDLVNMLTAAPLHFADSLKHE